MPLVLAGFGLLVAAGADRPGDSLPRIRIAPDGHGFVTTTGKRFVPFGVNYYRPGTGWAPQVWKEFEPEATRRDFARLHGIGANCIRVFLTYGSFEEQPGILSEDGFKKLDQFLNLAAGAGLYVQPTGPDHWEGLPEWARTDRISAGPVLQALEAFWRQLASRLRGRPEVFAYDLLNEPEVAWDSPPLREKWNQWLQARYGDGEALARGWGRTNLPPLGRIPPPPREDALLDPRLLDFQNFRESLAVDWTRRQAAAIKAADPDALVTVGWIQWSVPVVLADVGHYSGFRPEAQAPWIDFLTFHFYPLANGAYHYRSETDEARNLAYLDRLTRETIRFHKPVVLGEFGWYGGGRPRAFGDVPAATEDQQAGWCRRVVESTEGRLAGWLNWGLYDQPEATDVSQFTGLFTSEGTSKAWCRTFRSLAIRLRDGPRATVEPGADAKRPAIDWDRQRTSRQAVDAFREADFHAWQVAAPRLDPR